jgi:hypothetical protein
MRCYASMQSFLPFGSNPLKTRQHVADALRALTEPLAAYASAGGGRVDLGATEAHFDTAAAHLEGFARPLWGLAPAAAGGADWIDWAPIRAGLANGTDPNHRDYWGPARDIDQRLVEMAALGFTLAMVPEKIWDPQSAAAKEHIAAYLTHAHGLAYANNNWKFFRLMIEAGLRRVGIVPTETGLATQFRAELDAFYIGEGWYRDGPLRRVDHYIGFAMHFYGLLLAKLGWDDAIAAGLVPRARLFAEHFQHWFADDGAVVPYGRSMTYRFATGAFWGALAYGDDTPGLPWPVIKGLYMRHLRWWAARPIMAPGGILSVGYAYPNLLMSENYNSPGSPYWALKVFLPLALPDDHPFWQAEEAPLPAEESPVVQSQPGFVIDARPGNTVILSGGQQNLEMRFGAEKYAKFAYSSRYAFSIESNDRRFDQAAFDSMIGLSDDGRHFRVREDNELVLMLGAQIYARWRPFADVVVETLLLPDRDGWHVRLHRIDSSRPLHSAEGGFAIATTDTDKGHRHSANGVAHILTHGDYSAVHDLGSSVARNGLVLQAPPNTNLAAPHSAVPQLRAHLPAGRCMLMCAVGTTPLSDVAPLHRDADLLFAAILANGIVPAVMDGNPAS